MTHSILAPSSAAIWMQCPASVRMRLPYMNQPGTPESMEGDAAHWLACQIATNGPPSHPVGIKAPNGVTITQDMIDGAELFAEVVGIGANHERSVRGPSIHPALHGTPDADRNVVRLLRVFDYKFGHRFVEVFEMWQCLAYVASLFDSVYSRDQIDEIEIVVVQPRAYHKDGPVRTWRFPLVELQGYVERMHSAAHKAVDMHGVPRLDAPAQTGPGCRDCEARHECTRFQAVCSRLADEAGRTERFNLPPAQLGAELSYLDEAIERLEARRDGLAIQAETHMRAGKSVPGYEMGEGKANEKWRDDVSVDEVAEFARILDPSLIVCKDVELLTPTQTRAALKRRKIDERALDGYALRPRGAMKLQKSSTTRARRAFGAK